MIKEEITVYSDIKSLCRAFTNWLRELPFPTVRLALSGGSTPTALFDFWSAEEAPEWNRQEFFWGDERCVPPDHKWSNFGVTKKHLFDKLPGPGLFKWHRIYGENNPEEEVIRYSELLNKQLPRRNGIPSFDVIMLGLGEDGHTASIFPDRLDLWDSPADCVVAEHPETKQKRISITGRIINNACHVAFLVTGKSKAERVRDIITNREHFRNIYPGAKVEPRNGTLRWFLDKEAAALL